VSLGQHLAVISTHLDDAVFSVGGGIAALARRGIEVRVITVLAGDPTSNDPAGPWDSATGFRTAGEGARARREEDRRACRILGANPIWLPYRDEQYDRAGSDDEIADDLRTHLVGIDTVLVPGFPLLNQDHAWLSRLFSSIELPGMHLGLYAEQPYFLGQGPPRLLGQVEPLDPEPRWVPLSTGEIDRQAKAAARRAYRSQLVRLAQEYRCDWAELETRMAATELALGGELIIWVRSSSHGVEPAAPRIQTGPLRSGPRSTTWRHVIPGRIVRTVRSFRRWRQRPPRVGRVRFGSLRRAEPISRRFGFDRGRPVDRYYIEAFLGEHAADIRGRILEVGNDQYTRQFGHDIVQTDVLHAPPGKPEATIVADLSSGDGIVSGAFDCVLLTQTLQFIYPVQSVVSTVYRILRPGGVVLVTTPGISQIIRPDRQQWGEYWRLTSQSAERLFGEVFGEDAVSVKAYGNVLAATAFLYGLADRELDRRALDTGDADYEVLIGVRAVKVETRKPPEDLPTLS
jgi:LmbE family N-acetylglucosaminyl deacetylase/SAM-dependent methyltransferase